MENIAKLRALAGDRLVLNESLAPYTTFKIGGPAKYFFATDNPEEAAALLALAQKINLPAIVLGGGSNVLASDRGFAGLVVRLFGGKIKVKSESMECQAGAPLSKAVGEALAFSLSGLEWAIGIPGTVGGAVDGNAGAYGSDMAAIVSAVEVSKRGKKKIIKNKDCGFGYRRSRFKERPLELVILRVWLELCRGQQENIKNKMKEISRERQEKFEDYRCAGSIFANLELSPAGLADLQKTAGILPAAVLSSGRVPAAWLIDQCGLKGQAIGDAKISERHAGIIFNQGRATADQVAALISLVKEKVRNKFNVQLREEVVYLGFD